LDTIGLCSWLVGWLDTIGLCSWLVGWLVGYHWSLLLIG
jgi:hypothetical protein